MAIFKAVFQPPEYFDSHQDKELDIAAYSPESALDKARANNPDSTVYVLVSLWRDDECLWNCETGWIPATVDRRVEIVNLPD